MASPPPSPPPPPPSQQQQHTLSTTTTSTTRADQYAGALHTAAWTALIACPVLVLLPPRKLDFYTMGLLAMTGYSGNYIVWERSGRTLWGHMAQRVENRGRGEMQQPHRQALPPVPLLQQQKGGWKAQRQAEIREDVNEGKGIMDMIYDQVWEVWNQSKVRDEEEQQDES